MKRNTFIQYAMITVSCAVYAFGFDWCYDANHISVGGFTGIAQIINYFFPWAPVGTVAWILNIPLFVIGWKMIGKRLFFASLYGMTVTSVFIDLFAALHEFQPMDPILAALYGGVIAGVAEVMLT